MKTIFMKRADWEKWDAALRSGEYKQGRCRLKDGDRYCCLGVLQHCLTGEVEKDTYSEVFPPPTYGWLKEHKIQFTGGVKLETRNPYLPKLKATASNANDGDKTFIEIADAIKDCVEFIDEEEK